MATRRNTNYKLAAHGITIFSRMQAHCCCNFDVANEVDNSSMEFLCKTADLYLRILHTCLKIEYTTVYLLGYILLSRNNFPVRFPPSHERASIDPLIYRAPSSRTEYTKKKSLGYKWRKDGNRISTRGDFIAAKE